MVHGPELMDIERLRTVVAELIADGHTEKYVAFVLFDRTELSRKEIGTLLGIPHRMVSYHIRKVRELAIHGKAKAEALWTGCDAAFVDHQRRAA